MARNLREDFQRGCGLFSCGYVGRRCIDDKKYDGYDGAAKELNQGIKEGLFKMRTKRIVFVGERKAQLQEFELDESLAGHEIMVRTLYSIISAGTEGAAFTGLEREHPAVSNFSYPYFPGYGNLGEVLAVGNDVSDYRIGDIVFSTAGHQLHWKFDTVRGHLCVPVPERLPLLMAVFGRMAAVGIAAIRKADYSLGDKVLVIGAGLVGNFAAQEFQLAGCEVMLTDISEFRLQCARKCGITRVLNPNQDDLYEAVRAWTGDKGVQISVEAVGDVRLIAQAVELTRPRGEVILLGTPRKRLALDCTPMLSRIHLRGITMKGALEWLYPVRESDYQRFTVTGNLKQIFQWLKEGLLKTKPLLTHLFSPNQCQEAYEGLERKKDKYLGVVFDWSK